MSVFSRTTAIYVGTTSYSKAYVGDTQVWPLINGREVYAIYGSGSTENDLFLGINSSTTLKYRFRGKLTSYTGGAHICSQTSPDSNDYRFFVANSTKMYLDMGSKRLSKSNFIINSGLTGTEIDLTISNFSVYDNISQTTVVSGATAVSSVPQSEMRLLLNHLYVEAFQAWEGDTLISDCVPFVKSDGTIGLYDKVSGRFFAPDSQTNVYYLDPPVPPPVSGDYLTFEILTGGTIQLSGNCASAQTVQYRVNNGSWNTMTVCGATASDAITVNAGDIVEWKGNNLCYAAKKDEYFVSSFKGTSYYNVLGNILSLNYGDNAGSHTTMPNYEYEYFSLFGLVDAGVVSAEHLRLPNNVTPYCYEFMFDGCRSLISAPALPATTLAPSCYGGMFGDCSSLVTAPVLSAPTLADLCYMSMFDGCTSLNYIKCLATYIRSDLNILAWVYGVSPTGTFIKKAGVTWPTATADNDWAGIPSGWTVIEE